MKKILALLLTGLLAVGLTACSGGEESSSSSTSAESSSSTSSESTSSSSETSSESSEDASAAAVDLDALIEQIQTEVEIPSLTPADDELLQTIYGIDPADVEDYAGGFSMMNVHAADVMIVKAKPDTADAVRAGLESRIEAQKRAFENYLPDQYEAANSAEVEQYGDYLVLVILADEADTVRGIIADALA